MHGCLSWVNDIEHRNRNLAAMDVFLIRPRRFNVVLAWTCACQLSVWAARILVCVLGSAQLLCGDESVSFARDVRPILSDRCFICHGPDAARREADLRLDVQEAAYEFAIEPGEPDESELVARVNSDDPDLIMPPPDSKLTLTDAERDTLSRWIAQGGQYDEHWSFQPVQPPQSHSNDASDTTSPIDRFVQARLETHGMKAAARADGPTLIRRLSFDLRGLPPSIAEVDAFLADKRDDAYERLVDRFLASETFGERMAVDWLDVARYADTYGYQNDRYRPMWPWRDWVVSAFNDNLPYDKFITWQIAGDLLPNPTREQILATAFNRNHRQTNEGGSVEEEYRAEYVADRVNTFGAAFLGLTLECCRCHDHKYDPITQREYYQLSAYFNSIAESGLYSHFNEATPTPTLKLADLQLFSTLETLQSEIRTKQDGLEHLPIDGTAYQLWRESLADVRPEALSAHVGEESLQERIVSSIGSALIGDYPLEEGTGKYVDNRANKDLRGKLFENPKFEEGRIGNGIRLSGEDNVSVTTGGDFSRNQPFSISIWINPPKHVERAVVWHRSRAWTDAGSRGYELLIENGRLSTALIHFWPGNAIRIVSDTVLPVDRWTHVTVVYDGSSRAAGLAIFVDGDEQDVTIARDNLTKHIKGSDGFSGGDADQLVVGQRFRDVGFKGGRVDELKVFNRNLTPLEAKLLYMHDAMKENVPEVLYNVSEELLLGFYSATQENCVARAEELRQLRDAYSEVADPVPEIMVMREDPTPRPTYVLIRGAYDAIGDPVERGTPARILPREPKPTSDRRDLASWLVDPQHPLTARVAVNRFWQSLFGHGIVTTAEDFGLQGSLPSHPELLDWLAYEFVGSGWNVKQLIKTIVMSGTYQQVSNPTEQLLQIDPDNALLGRGPAVRLSAEMIRDQALMASGLLVAELGGPPVKPYQPAGLWKEKSGKVYERDTGEGSRRRSLYTYWKRTSPPPSMMTFDASNREVCVVRRQATMTPLQMLVLLNDPQYVEAARALAETAFKKTEDIPQQLTYVFRSLTTRRPNSKELKTLHTLFVEQHEMFARAPETAEAILGVGDHRYDRTLDAAQLAALTVVAEGLMSFDETVMKR